jgi:tetratricopeptide (TPR) repeat protein
MTRWEFEQWQAARAARDMAKNPFGLLIVGVIVTLFASASSQNQSKKPLTAEQYVDRAHDCVGRLACEESMANVQQALKLDPNLAKAYVTRGSLQLRQSQLKAVQPALRDYERARLLYQQEGKSDAASAVDKTIDRVKRNDFPDCLPVDPEAVGICL